jgi:ankyrin repeat protein
MSLSMLRFFRFLSSFFCTGWTSTVKILTDHGADVNAPTIVGKTPLMYAVEFDHESLVFWFVSQAKKLHLRIDATDVDGYTALIRAVEKGLLCFMSYVIFLIPSFLLFSLSFR